MSSALASKASQSIVPWIRPWGPRRSKALVAHIAPDQHLVGLFAGDEPSVTACSIAAVRAVS